MTSKMVRLIRSELLSLICSAPLLQSNLRATVSNMVVATDAPEKGGAVGVAESLSEEGADFSESQRLKGDNEQGIIPVLVLSLFNGTGGCFWAYDMAVVTPMGRIAAEVNEAANRVCSRRWPGLEIVKDVYH